MSSPLEASASTQAMDITISDQPPQPSTEVEQVASSPKHPEHQEQPSERASAEGCELRENKWPTAGVPGTKHEAIVKGCGVRTYERKN